MRWRENGENILYIYIYYCARFFFFFLFRFVCSTKLLKDNLLLLHSFGKRPRGFFFVHMYCTCTYERDLEKGRIRISFPPPRRNCGGRRSVFHKITHVAFLENNIYSAICFDHYFETKCQRFSPLDKRTHRLKMLLPKSKPYLTIPNLLRSSPYIPSCSIWSAEINSDVGFQTAL